MAIISFGQGQQWGAARWVFDYVIEKILARVPGGDPLHTLLLEASFGYYHLDVTRMDAAQKRRFAAEVRAVLNEVLSGGSGKFASPEFYDGLCERIRELDRMAGLPQ